MFPVLATDRRSRRDLNSRNISSRRFVWGLEEYFTYFWSVTSQCYVVTCGRMKHQLSTDQKNRYIARNYSKKLFMMKRFRSVKILYSIISVIDPLCQPTRLVVRLTVVNTH